MSALNVWGMGTILINGRGLEDHILRHEMIHHWQVQTYGLRPAASGLPRWFIEGMAYALSEDPRNPLPRADIQDWRLRFEGWVADGNDWRTGYSDGAGGD